MRFRSIVLAAAAAPLLIAAEQPVRLQPASPWDVDYAENSCRLIRTFGEGKTLTKLAFESAPGAMDLLVIGKPLNTFEEQVPARFLPVGGKTFDGRFARTVPSGVPAILWSDLRMLPDSLFDQLKKQQEELGKNAGVRPPPVSLAEKEYYKNQARDFAAAATEFEIQTRHNRSVILETGSLGQAMAAFEQCTRDSLKDWGVDPDIEDKIVRPVWMVNPSDWLFASDYPGDMLRSGKESEVVARLLIDAAGKITKCTSLSHFNEVEFNRITCANIIKRARFEPAELADGTKVPSYMVRRVIFRIAH
jgi:hypothetical protein